MTLSRSPTKKRQTTSTTRKRHARHHTQTRHYIKPYWPYLPMLAIVAVGFVVNTWIAQAHRNVLGYATSMSVQALLDGTNQQRAANGLPALNLDGRLNTSAQNKAQDMEDNDYWAHTSPSGLTPWYWITAAGYSYSTAGENLAYGFATASDTITGWMNSPGHRANILNTSYVDVGFGFVNAPNYQSSGPQTIVVAHYASPYVAPAPAPAPAPTPTVTAITPAPATTPSAQPTQTAAPTEQPAPAEPAPTQTTTTPQTPADTAKQSNATQPTPAQKSTPSQGVTRVQVLTADNVAWTQFAVSMVASVALLIFLLRHSFAWHKVLVKGEGFFLKHPLLDIAFVAIATLGYILSQTTGFIR